MYYLPNLYLSNFKAMNSLVRAEISEIALQHVSPEGVERTLLFKLNLSPEVSMQTWF
jgi:hypothetical protein